MDIYQVIENNASESVTSNADQVENNDNFDIYIKVIYVMYDKLVSAKRSMQVGGERERGPSTKQLVSLLNFVLQPSLTIQRLTLPIFSYTINRYIVHCSVNFTLWTKYTTIGIHDELCPITSFDQLHLYFTKKAFLDVYTINKYIVRVILNHL